jgi:hypothetical protein
VLLKDVWKAMGIVEVMQKTNQSVPLQVQVKLLSSDAKKTLGIVEVMQKTNQPVSFQVQVKPLFQDVRMSSRRPTCLSLLKSR